MVLLGFGWANIQGCPQLQVRFGGYEACSLVRTRISKRARYGSGAHPGGNVLNIDTCLERSLLVRIEILNHISMKWVANPEEGTLVTAPSELQHRAGRSTRMTKIGLLSVNVVNNAALLTT